MTRYTKVRMMNRGFVARASVTVEAAPADVWDALVNPEAIRQYMLGTKVTTDWKEGSPIVWRGEWKGRVYEDRGTILKIDRGRVLQYSHFSPLSGERDVPENYHTVTIQLSGHERPIEVSLSQDNNPTEEAREHAEKNWRTMLDGLKRLVEG